MAETLFIEGKIQYYESCNQPAIANAKNALLEMKVLAKNGPAYLVLGPQYLAKGEGEKNLLSIIEYLREFRSKPAADALIETS